jgi:hypothetical protein
MGLTFSRVWERMVRRVTFVSNDFMIDGGENLRFVHGAVTRGIFWY